MPRILPIILFFFITSSAFAGEKDQQETLLISGKTKKGLYFAPVLQASSVSGNTVYLSGFRGACLVNHTAAYGYGSYSVGGKIAASAASRQYYGVNGQPRTKLKIDFSYGGGEFEYINNWK